MVTFIHEVLDLGQVLLLGWLWYDTYWCLTWCTFWFLKQWWYTCRVYQHKNKCRIIDLYIYERQSILQLHAHLCSNKSTCTGYMYQYVKGTRYSILQRSHGNIKFKPLFTTFPYMHINVRKLSKYERLGKMHIKISL